MWSSFIGSVMRTQSTPGWMVVTLPGPGGALKGYCRALFTSGSSVHSGGSGGAHWTPLIWPPPSANSVLPVR